MGTNGLIMPWVGSQYNHDIGGYAWRQNGNPVDTDLYTSTIGYPQMFSGRALYLTRAQACPASSKGALTSNYAAAGHPAICEEFP